MISRGGFDMNFHHCIFESLLSLSLNGEILGYSLCVKRVFVLESDFHVVQVMPRGLKEASSALHGVVCSPPVMKLLPPCSCAAVPYAFCKKKVK